MTEILTNWCHAAGLPATRVVTPNLRFGSSPVNAILLLDDPGVIADRWPGTKIAHARCCRVGVDGATKMANPHNNGKAVFVEIEFADLGGDMAAYNGLHLLHGQTWPAMEWDDVYDPNIPSPWLFCADAEGDPIWVVRLLANNDADCIQLWSLSDNSNIDPEGDYILEPGGLYGDPTCVATGCADTDTCTLSSGATCRVRWAGATWL